MPMNKQLIKQETDALIEELPEEISWDDLMYRIYVRQKIENGLQAMQEGNVHSTEDLERKFHIGQ
jgi:hypothetical protein